MTPNKIPQEIENKSCICYKRGFQEGQKQKVDEDRTQTLEKVKKMIEDVGLEDVIDFLDGLKDFTINEEHPFGTCDYMAIDDMIFRINKLLSQLEDDEVEK
jgi:hypothetical protein